MVDNPLIIDQAAVDTIYRASRGYNLFRFLGRIVSEDVHKCIITKSRSCKCDSLRRFVFCTALHKLNTLMDDLYTLDAARTKTW